jgi:plasmid stabilization system protein ParE
MSFFVRVTGRAEREFDRMIAWIAHKSAAGAQALERAYSKALTKLAESPFTYPFAPEGERVNLEVRQFFFQTRSGKPYRGLFMVRDQIVWILHFRGPGQDLLRDIVPPPEDLPS